MSPPGSPVSFLTISFICLLLAACGTESPAEGSLDAGGAGLSDATSGGDGAVQSDVVATDAAGAKDTGGAKDTSGGDADGGGPACVEGLPCDDGDPCTVSATCKGGVCVPGKASFCECTKTADCAAKEDGDLCTGTLMCDMGSFPYRCVVNPATVPTCKPTDPGCQQATCDPKTGKCTTTAVADGAACDDDDPCTQPGSCKGGVCALGVNTCACATDADCAPQEDGDLCNGTLYCDTDSGACKVNPKTVVSCPSGNDTACLKNTCVPKTGKCEPTPTPTKTACDDGDSCTKGDYCALGTCVSGTNTCLCTTDADCEAKQGDGDFCNGTMFCNKVNGLCEVNPNTVVVCKSVNDTACRMNACVNVFETKGDGKGGSVKLATSATCTMVDVPDAKKQPCDDGDPCTVGEVCIKGSCTPSADVCGCKSDLDCAKEEDGDLCNGTLFCDKATATCKLNPKSVVKSCPTVDNTDCAKRKCVPKTGKCELIAEPEGSSCSDGDGCTTGDVCAAGTCIGKFTCACKSDADCLATDDGDLCNGVPYCDKSTPGKHVCKPNPASKVFCPQNVNTQCLQNQCNAKDGKCSLQPFPGTKTCDDGDPCTAKDLCQGSACVGSGKTDCDDGSLCTTDSCDPKLGCVHKQENCDDGNTCTADKCDPKTGKCDFGTKLKDGAACNADNDGCTLNDTCDKGACFAGAKVKCEIGEGPCELAVCQSKGASAYTCVKASKPDGAACDDGESCTLGTTCKGGQCQSGGVERLWTLRRFEGAKDDFAFGPLALLGKTLVSGGVRTTKDAKGQVAGRALALMGWADGGKLAWQDSRAAKDKSAEARAVAIVVKDAALAMFIGQVRTAGQDRLYAWRVTAAGKTLSTVEAAAYPTMTARAALGLANGQVWVTGEAVDKAGGAPEIMLVRLSGTGQLAWKHRFPSTKGALGHAMAGLPGNHLVMAGATAPVAGVRRGLLVRSDAGGQVKWQRTLHQDNKATELRAVHATSDGTLTVAGHTQKSTGWYGLLLRVDGSGKELWRRTTLNPTRIHALHRLDSGKLLLAGAQQDATVGDIAWLGMRDPIGNVVWDRPFNVVAGQPVVDQARIDHVEPHGDGFAIGGSLTRKADGALGGLLGRVAGFGYNTCSTAGACAGKAADGCDDGKPCTLDLCDTKTGKCTHTSLDGLICDPEDGCTLVAECQKGKCVADPNGKLWTRNYPWEDVKGGGATVAKGAARVVGLKDGGTLVVGHWEHATVKNTLRLRKLSPTGTLVWQEDLVRAKGTFATYNSKSVAKDHILKIEERSNGEIWIFTKVDLPSSGHHKQTKVFRVSADGNEKLGMDWSYPEGKKPELMTAEAELPDGSSVQAYWNGGFWDWKQRGRFVRRDAAGKVVTSLNNRWFTRHMLPAPQLSTILVGETADYVRCRPSRVGPSGVVQWHALEIPSKASCPKRVTFCRIGRLEGEVLSVAMTDGCIGGYETHRLRVAQYDASTGTYRGSRVWAPPLGAGLQRPSVFPGPHGGFAIFYKVTSPKQDARVYATDLFGRLVAERTLPNDASYTATAFGATADHLIWAGRRVGSSGAIETGITHTGGWGYSTCPAAGQCKDKLDAGACDDGNPCTLDTCAADAGCEHSALSCDDGNFCTTDSCDKTLGCVHKPIACTDGLACTQDLCDPHAAGKDGKTGCSFPVIQQCIDGNACTADLCDAKTGKCANPTLPCDDGDPCTQEGCSPKWGCLSSPVKCDDQDPCTFDQCIKGVGCKYTAQANGAPRNDGAVCKLGKGTCTDKGCSVAGVGIPTGCSRLKPTAACQTAKTEAKGKLDGYIGPVWFTVDGKPSLETCDMPAGGFRLRATFAELDKSTQMAPGAMVPCGGVGTSPDYVGWQSPVVTGGAGSATVPVQFTIAVPTPHTAVRVRIRATGSGGYSAYKDKLKLQILLDGKKAFDGKYGAFPNLTWNGNDASHSNSHCPGMHKSRHHAQIDVQAPHTGSTVKVLVSMSSDVSGFWGRHIFHHVEVWTK